MEKYLIYGINLLVIALPLALFEIVIEKGNGWGSGWNKDKWYSKQFFPNNPIVKFLTKLLKTELPLISHFFIFSIFLPTIFILQYFFLTKDITLLLASYVGVVVLEDLLWFLLNWYFDSFRQLLKGPNGSIWWHKRWLKISTTYYLPLSYIYGLSLSILLLLLAN